MGQRRNDPSPFSVSFHDAARLATVRLKVHRHVLGADRFAIIDDSEVQTGAIASHLNVEGESVERYTFRVGDLRQRIEINLVGPGDSAELFDCYVTSNGGRQHGAVMQCLGDLLRRSHKESVIRLSNWTLSRHVVALAKVTNISIILSGFARDVECTYQLDVPVDLIIGLEHLLHDTPRLVHQEVLVAVERGHVHRGSIVEAGNPGLDCDRETRIEVAACETVNDSTTTDCGPTFISSVMFFSSQRWYIRFGALGLKQLNVVADCSLDAHAKILTSTETPNKHDILWEEVRSSDLDILQDILVPWETGPP